MTGPVASVVLLLASLVMLYFGAQWMVRGASRAARALNISPLIIGLTIVAYATSAPELVVGVTASLRNVSEVSLGNIIGANVACICSIMGLSALVRPVRVRHDTWRKEMLVVLVPQLLLFAFCLDGRLARWEGAVLIGVFLVSVILAVRAAKGQGGDHLPEQIIHARSRLWVIVLLLVLGLGLLVVGGNVLVRSAVEVAKAAGMSNLTIGLTIVAMGTTVPELATSIVAARQGEGDISLGNAVGSVFFNTAFILGLAAVLNPIAVPPGEAFVKIPVMILVVAVLIPFLRTGFVLTRLEGALLLACYVGFLAYSVWSGVGG
jgi:cation:H+ antiporter